MAQVAPSLGFNFGGFTTLLGFAEWSYVVMFLAIAIGGPGVLSLDAFIARRLHRSKDEARLPKPLLRPSPINTNG